MITDATKSILHSWLYFARRGKVLTGTGKFKKLKQVFTDKLQNFRAMQGQHMQIIQKLL